MIVALLLAALATARAQDDGAPARDDTVDDETRARARELFDEGIEHFRAGRYAEARDLLVRSLELAPNAGAAFNLAHAYRRTGELVAAEAVLESLLASEHGPLAPERAEQAEMLLGEIRADLGTLAIQLMGGGRVTVLVDGRGAAQTDGEFVEVRVDPGQRLIGARAPGRESRVRRVNVPRGGRVELALVLDPASDVESGTLVLEAAPGQRVEIEGHATGIGTLRRELPAGEYVVRAGDREETVTVEANEVVRHSFSDEAVYEGPAFWLVTGGALAACVAAAVVLVLALQPNAPIEDPEFGVIRL